MALDNSDNDDCWLLYELCLSYKMLIKKNSVFYLICSRLSFFKFIFMWTAEWYSLWYFCWHFWFFWYDCLWVAQSGLPSNGSLVHRYSRSLLSRPSSLPIKSTIICCEIRRATPAIQSCSGLYSVNHNLCIRNEIIYNDNKIICYSITFDHMVSPRNPSLLRI